MDRFCDLHVHSTYSDGTQTPTWILQEAVRLGLGAVALCDHNTTAGLPEFFGAAKGKPIEAIGGCEFSVDYENGELHILGLFLEPKHFPAIGALLAKGVADKERSNRELVERLKEAGYPLDYDAIRASTPNGQVNRALIAAEMQRLGYIREISEAFRGILSEKNGLYRRPSRPQALEVIAFLRELGAVPVLAHPFLNLNEAGLRRFLEKAVPAGLVGMETLYVSNDDATNALSSSIAREYGLLPGGGSDYHGGNKPEIALGTGYGALRVPMSFPNALRNHKKKL